MIMVRVVPHRAGRIYRPAAEDGHESRGQRGVVLGDGRTDARRPPAHARCARPGVDSLVWEQEVLLLDHTGDHAGPARLVARADAGAIVAVKVLVEEDQIPPVRIFLELRGATVDRAAAIGATDEDADHAPRELVRDLR